MILGAWRHLPFYRQSSQEPFDFYPTESLGVATTVGFDKTPDPSQVGMLSSQAVVVNAQSPLRHFKKAKALALGKACRIRSFSTDGSG